MGLAGFSMVGVARIELATPAMSTLGCGAKPALFCRFWAMSYSEQIENIGAKQGVLPQFYRAEITRGPWPRFLMRCLNALPNRPTASRGLTRFRRRGRSTGSGPQLILESTNLGACLTLAPAPPLQAPDREDGVVAPFQYHRKFTVIGPDRASSSSGAQARSTPPIHGGEAHATQASGRREPRHSGKGPLTVAGLLLTSSIILWTTRLQYRIFLSERHLSLDADERRPLQRPS